MKRSSKILIFIIVGLIFIGGCAMAGMWKANQNSAASKPQTSTKQSTTKKTQAAKSVKKSSTATNDNSKSSSAKQNDDNFVNTPWTTQSALDFLQKVNDASDAGREVVGEEYAEYLPSTVNYGNFPGNSIFLMENNRSGVGDGGVVLTKSDDKTVTLTFGEGAGSSPIEKVIVDANTYQVLSRKTIHVPNQQSMWEYFGISVPRNSDNNESDSASDNDNQSDSNDDNSQSTDTNQNQSDDSDD